MYLPIPGKIVTSCTFNCSHHECHFILSSIHQGQYSALINLKWKPFTFSNKHHHLQPHSIPPGVLLQYSIQFSMYIIEVLGSLPSSPKNVSSRQKWNWGRDDTSASASGPNVQDEATMLDEHVVDLSTQTATAKLQHLVFGFIDGLLIRFAECVPRHLATHKVVAGGGRPRAIQLWPRNASVLYLVDLGQPNGTVVVATAAMATSSPGNWNKYFTRVPELRR